MTYDDLYRTILKILPEAVMGEDNDGQLTVYTDRMIDPHGDGEKLIPFNAYMDNLTDFAPEQS